MLWADSASQQSPDTHTHFPQFSCGLKSGGESVSSRSITPFSSASPARSFLLVVAPPPSFPPGLYSINTPMAGKDRRAIV